MHLNAPQHYECTLLIPSCVASRALRPAFMHLIIKVNLSLPLLMEASITERKALGVVGSAHSLPLCLLCFESSEQGRTAPLLLELFRLRCVWARWWWWGVYKKREGTKAERRKGGSVCEDDETGVEFTHPAGRVNYWLDESLWKWEGMRVKCILDNKGMFDCLWLSIKRLC